MELRKPYRYSFGECESVEEKGKEKKKSENAEVFLESQASFPLLCTQGNKF